MKDAVAVNAPLPWGREPLFYRTDAIEIPAFNIPTMRIRLYFRQCEADIPFREETCTTDVTLTMIVSHRRLHLTVQEESYETRRRNNILHHKELYLMTSALLTQSAT
jgi:hypothetical protein